MELRGKLPPGLLREVVLDSLPPLDDRVLVGPSVGEDAAVIDYGDRVLVVHSDPITGAVRNIGWLAVHIACNDVATQGARPLWILPVVLVPPGWGVEGLRAIVSDIRRATEELRVSVVGGHTEFTPGIDRPILAVTVLGEAPRDRYVTTSGCRPGDLIILTKGLAIEGAAIIASEMEEELAGVLGRGVVEEAKGLIRMISVVEDALTAVSAGGVHAMHDPTEGGVAGGLQELAIASGVGVVAYEERMPMHPAARRVLEAVGADPLTTISSGSLLIAADRGAADGILASLRRRGIEARVVGEVVGDPGRRVVVRRDGSVLDLGGEVRDDLWRVLAPRLGG